MYYSDYYRQNQEYIAGLEKAINGEYSAIHCYGVLEQLSPNDIAKKRIEEIRNDEIKHFNSFNELYMMLTGKQAVPQLIEKCANQFLVGVESAFLDEQETVDYYMEMAEKSPNQKAKEIFMRAAMDEQNHAVWFLYFQQKLQK